MKIDVNVETHSIILLHSGGLLIVMNTQLDRIVTMMNMLNNLLNSQGAVCVWDGYIYIYIMFTATVPDCTQDLLPWQLETVTRKKL